VLEGGKLVGVLSERDLSLVSAIGQRDEMPVDEAMAQVPYTVDENAELAQVAGEMARRKYGSAIIVRGDKPIGIFTTVDACRALEELLREKPAPPALVMGRRAANARSR
jgi:acetoin utilization protein AcuB